MSLPDLIVAALADAGRPLRRAALVDAIYGGRPDGGPVAAAACVSVTVSRMRKHGDRRIVTLSSGYALSEWSSALDADRLRRGSEGLKQAVLATLRSATEPLTGDRIAALVYADDPSGGPGNAAGIVRLAIGSLRDDGHVIAVRMGRIGGYRLGNGVVGTDVSERRERVRRLRRSGKAIPQIASALGLSPSVVASDLRALGLGRRPAVIRDRVLDVLRTTDHPIPAARIADLVYADDPDGGPLAAREVVWATIRDLKKAGHRISAPRGSGGYTYGGMAA